MGELTLEKNNVYQRSTTKKQLGQFLNQPSFMNRQPTSKEDQQTEYEKIQEMLAQPEV